MKWLTMGVGLALIVLLGIVVMMGTGVFQEVKLLNLRTRASTPVVTIHANSASAAYIVDCAD